MVHEFKQFDSIQFLTDYPRTKRRENENSKVSSEFTWRSVLDAGRGGDAGGSGAGAIPISLSINSRRREKNGPLFLAGKRRGFVCLGITKDPGLYSLYL